MADEEILPALTAEEWALLAASNNGEPTTYVSYHGSQPEKHIAEGNYRLSDDNPRKITWEMVRMLRDAAERIHVSDGLLDEAPDSDSIELNRLADILASYLPPRA